MKKYAWTCGAVVLAAACLIIAPEARSQKDGEARVAEVIHIMKGIQQPANSDLMKARRGEPESERDWEKIEIAAGVLNESGFILMESGRSLDDVWAKSCADLRSASAEVLAAAKKRDYAALKDAIPKVGMTCKSCHDVHNQ